MTGQSFDDTHLESHFRFGRNWRSYAAGVGEKQIDAAVAGLKQLVPEGRLAGKRFLDIGCGSGLSMLAAQRLGASSIHGMDIDPESVEAARNVLGRFAADGSWSLQTASILDAPQEDLDTFDIVHSWGVLHHTGRIWDALANAASLVESDGLLVVALYRRTPLCRLWTVEKRFYAHAPNSLQAVVRAIYRTTFLPGLSPRDGLQGAA